MLFPFDTARTQVLARYGSVVADRKWVPLGSGGGLSGANVWRGEDANGTPLFALKAWPDSMPEQQVDFVHGSMAKVAHLPFVPSVLPTIEFKTATTEAGRVWDLCRWMPGTASATPPRMQIANACTAMAALHRVWRVECSRQPCPGVLSRLSWLEEFRARDWKWNSVHEKLDPLLHQAKELALQFPRADVNALRMWSNIPVAVHPCIRDLRADHVLFTGNDVTGIIDYGAMAIDHPAVDLARYLGESASDPDVFAAGLAAYRDAGGMLDVPAEFVHLLDRTGVFCSLIGWLRRTLTVHPSLFDPRAVATRMSQLIARGAKFLPSDPPDSLPALQPLQTLNS